MKVLIMAGGTGGHIFPALVIAKELIARGHQILWLGTKQGMEHTLVPEHNLPISYIDVAGLRRQSLWRKLLAPLQLLQATYQAFNIIRKFKPDALLGMGGYVTGPGGLAGYLAKVPLYIHEQNAIPGLTNKILARLACKIFTGFPESLARFSHKAIFVGNPIRSEIINLPLPEERDILNTNRPLKILVLGGSRGARSINMAIPASLKNWPEQLVPEIWHQCGAKDLDEVTGQYLRLGVKAKVEPFIKNMAQAYAWADLVICRAGALTVSELSSAGVASILIPYPFAVDDHQTKNAYHLSKNLAAILFPENKLTAPKLQELLINFNYDRARLLEMAKAARKLAKNDALEFITKEMLN
jgi:UDP-N-acetylglucosamine--N-acetylmuramyl-(pentapeptide) pyrophosphoryl-undecaprenol N-acetylglucosamine transferase